MADVLKLAFILSATDKMSRVIDSAVSKSIGNLSSLERRAAKTAKSFTKAGAIMAGAGGAVGGALISLGKQAGDYAGAVNDMSEATGISTEGWQKMVYAAKMSGIEQEKLSSSMVKFDKLIASAAGGSKTAAQTFKDLGVKLYDAGGKLRTPNELFKDVANVLSQTENGAEKTAKACELFGKSGAELMPMLNEGRSGLEKLYEAAEKSGNVLDDKTITSCDEFGKKMDAVNLQIKGLGLTLGATLAPILHQLANNFSSVIQKITAWAQKNPGLAKTIATIAIALSGLLIGLGTIAMVIGGGAFVVGKSITAWRGLCSVIKMAQGLFMLAKNSMLVFRIQYAALVVWQKLAAAAQWLFNSSLMSCPLVWIVAAVAAIGVAAYLLIKNWDKVSAFFKKLWDGIKKMFVAAWEWIKGMFLNYTAAGLVIKHWDTILAWFARLWDGVKAAFVAAWEWIKNMFLNYTAAGLVIKHWDAILAWFARLWDGVKGIFSGAWDGIRGIFSALNPAEWMAGFWEKISTFFTELPGRFFDFGRNLIAGLTDGIKSMATEAWDTITGLGEGIKDKFKSFFGINSPSKLFAQYGVNITQGLTGGMEKGTPAVTASTQELASTATRNLTTEMSSPLTTAPATSGGVSLTYAPNVTINGGASPAALDEFGKLLRLHKDEIIKIIRQMSDDKTRLSFN